MDEDMESGRCAACGDYPDYCLGHGPIGDPRGYAILVAHDEDEHSNCNPLGCEIANDMQHSMMIAGDTVD